MNHYKTDNKTEKYNYKPQLKQNLETNFLLGHMIH
jgi:hypothetical protein